MKKIDKKYIQIKNWFLSNLKDECGMGVIEVTLIVVVLVGLAVLFKSEIEGVAAVVFNSLKNKVKEI